MKTVLISSEVVSMWEGAMSVKLLRNILTCVVLGFLAKLPLPAQDVDFLVSWSDEQHVSDLYYDTFSVSVGINGSCESGATCGAGCGIAGAGCYFPVYVQEDAIVAGLDYVSAQCEGDSLFGIGWAYAYWFSVCGPIDFNGFYAFGG